MFLEKRIAEIWLSKRSVGCAMRRVPDSKLLQDFSKGLGIIRLSPSQIRHVAREDYQAATKGCKVPAEAVAARLTMNCINENLCIALTSDDVYIRSFAELTMKGLHEKESTSRLC